MNTTDDRLTELDWVRIGAFALLIVYHVGMFYVPWDWHVKSPHPVAALEPWMQLSSPWRLSLLFVVSGAATGLMLQRGGPESGAGARSRRLLLPLLLGMAVIVPPQPYLEVVEKVGYGGSYVDFLGRYFRGDPGFCAQGSCLTLPTWNHLWFLPYLWVYTMVLLLARRIFGSAWITSPRWRLLTRGTRLLWWPCLLLALVRLTLLLRFPATHNLVWDWFNHSLYAPMFLLGVVLFARRDDAQGAWAAAVHWRWWALLLSLLTLAGMPWALNRAGGWEALPPAAQNGWLMLGALRHWLPIVAILGFARLHLRGRDGPWRRVLTEAVFPFYVVHQTVIVIVAHKLAPLGWPQPLEACVVLAATAAGCWGSYLLARRIGWLRPWMGLGPIRPAPGGAVAMPRPR
jgi:surface polysaccharide O-acyltransferase-like enzyme